MNPKYLIMMLLLTAVLVSAESTAPDDWNMNFAFWDDSGRGTGSITTDWYEVEDWEIEVCSKWGGTGEAQTTASSTITGPEQYVYQITVALNAQKTEYEEELLNETLYEVSWYIQPMAESGYFAVKLQNSDDEDTEYKVQEKTEMTTAGSSGYLPFYSEEEYDIVKIGYYVEGSTELTVLTVPIVDSGAETYSYGSSVSSGSTTTSVSSGSTSAGSDLLEDW